MPEVEVEVRRYIDAIVEQVPPVSADEARKRAAGRGVSRHHRLVLVAALVVAIAGMVAGGAMLLGGSRSTSLKVSSNPTAAALPLDVNGHVTWLLEVYNERHSPSDEEIRQRFAATFLNEIPPPEVRSVATAVARDGDGWTILREIERRERSAAVQLVSGDDTQAMLSLAIDTDGRIRFLLIRLAEPCPSPVPPQAATVPPAVGARLQWFIDAMNNDDPLTDDELSSVFTPDFLQSVSPGRVREIAREVRSDAPLAIRYFEGAPAERQVTVRLGTEDGRESRLRISIERGDAGRISELSLRPNPLPCVQATAAGP